MTPPSSLRWWFVPARCGDFRLEARGPSACRLTVIDPTEEDNARLAPFLAAVAKLDRAWWEKMLLRSGTPKTYTPTGTTTIDFARPLVELGPLLAGTTVRSDRPEVWTAVRHEGGVFMVDGPTLTPNNVRLAALEDDAKALREGIEALKAKVPDPVAAVTVAAPRRGCPAPSAATRRASEVLRTFCTARQFAQYQNEGRMRVLGNWTGKTYFVHHRDEAFARGLSRCVTEAATGRPLCAWDEEVPPEEETLSLKLALEHRERHYCDLLLGG